MDDRSYLTIRTGAEAEYVDRRSRFIAAIEPVADEEAALAFIAARKKKYWDARHNVHAYVLRNGISRFSDDGEPQGTAGLPMLETLQKRGLTDCVVVVTRYFGGILLGTGGLVRAYSQSTSLAIDAAGVGECRPCAVGEIACDYAQYGRVAPLVSEFGGRVTDTAFAEGVTLQVLLPLDRVGGFVHELTELSAGTLKFQQNDEIFEFFEKK
ncbi:MAG: YigZ family protein [Clostridia bacterium]|nr:YigZ family protein [Clostridia bacterium]